MLADLQGRSPKPDKSRKYFAVSWVMQWEKLTCGKAASLTSLAALNSPTLLSIPASSASASSRMGTRPARSARLAARTARLKPFSGLPAAAKTLAFSVRRCRVWARSVLGPESRDDIFERALGRFCERVRNVISRRETWFVSSGSAVGRSGRRWER